MSSFEKCLSLTFLLCFSTPVHIKNVEVRLKRNADLHDAGSGLEVRKTLRG